MICYFIAEVILENIPYMILLGAACGIYCSWKDEREERGL